jgi:hemolysin activation/secretion protein
VLIGQYDQIQVRNNSDLRQTAIDRVLSPLKSGQYIRKETLERTLLLLSATDGISSKATLTAGGAPGTSSGIAKTTSIYESVILKRSRDFNLTGRIGFDHKELEDRIDYFGSNGRKSADVWNLGISGNSRDNAGGGGYNSFGLTFALGHLDMDSADAVTADSSAHTAGHYTKANLNLYRIQSLAPVSDTGARLCLSDGGLF